MATQDKGCTIVPYFKVSGSQLKNMASAVS